jgi:hypothetical protein
MKSDRFVFLHIMKTGGTSIRDSLKECYGRDMMVDYSYRHDREKGKGLLSFKKSLTIYPENYEDFKVIFGHFNFDKYSHLKRPTITFLREPISRVESHYSRNWARNPRFRLEEFCQITSNIMTFMTGGDLSKFLFVGIMEYFPLSISKLSKVLGKTIYMQRKNVTSYKYHFSKQDRDIVKKYNLDDIELYKQALDRFRGNSK